MRRDTDVARDDVRCFLSSLDTDTCLAFVVAGSGAHCHHEHARTALLRGRPRVNGSDRHAREPAPLSEIVALPNVDRVGHGIGAQSIWVGKGHCGVRHVLRGTAVPAAVEAVVRATLRA